MPTSLQIGPPCPRDPTANGNSTWLNSTEHTTLGHLRSWGDLCSQLAQCITWPSFGVRRAWELMPSAQWGPGVLQSKVLP